MALSKNFIILFGIVFTLLLYISSNAALASRQLYQLSEEKRNCNTAGQAQVVGCGSPTRSSPVKKPPHSKDPPSEHTPCKGSLASRQLYQLSDEESRCNNPRATIIVGCGSPPVKRSSPIKRSPRSKDPPSQRTPCKGC
ncbi:unnamed protein product [Trifolium pratense]|uniref:Uncharacterized protein n=1 Tax=Trifolium pratense TaxID=57577 RepID=A0ACB0IX16_TRIPR|nr:unnamed protein product [Trifolium pratense]